MDHATWMRLAADEYRRVVGVLDALDAAQWSAPTDCVGWDVRALVAHLVGAAAWTISVRELIRQQRRGRRQFPGVDTIDAMNALQVREREAWAASQLLRELADLAPRAVRARSRIPAPLRAVPIPFGPPLGTKPLGYLTDRILTRDVWLHRVDICRATGHPLEVSAEHDGRIVRDVVREWRRLHGADHDVRLTGPAGGHWVRGTVGEPLEMDAVEFCRTVSGRAPGTGLLATRVDF